MLRSRVPGQLRLHTKTLCQKNKQKIKQTLHEKVTEHRKSMLQLEIESVEIHVCAAEHSLCSTWLPCLACFLEAKTLVHETDKKAHPNPQDLKGLWDLKLTLVGWAPKHNCIRDKKRTIGFCIFLKFMKSWKEKWHPM